MCFCSGATSVVKEVTQKGTKQNFAMKVIQKNVSCIILSWMYNVFGFLITPAVLVEKLLNLNVYVWLETPVQIQI